MPLTQLLSFHILTCPPLTRSLSFRILTSSSFCSPQPVGAPPLAASFQLIECSLALSLWCPNSIHSLALWWPLPPALCRVSSLPCLPPVVPDASGSKSSRFSAVAFSAPPAGSTPVVLLGHGRGSTSNGQPSPSCMRINA